EPIRAGRLRSHQIASRRKPLPSGMGRSRAFLVIGNQRLAPSVAVPVGPVQLPKMTRMDRHRAHLEILPEPDHHPAPMTTAVFPRRDHRLDQIPRAKPALELPPRGMPDWKTVPVGPAAIPSAMTARLDPQGLHTVQLEVRGRRSPNARRIQPV